MSDFSEILHSKHIILFDGVCNLCNGFMMFVYNRDPHAKFTFAWIQSKQGKQILEQLKMPTEEYDTIIYLKGGQPSYKSTAFLKIVNHLKFPWPVLWIGVIIPLFIRNWLYDLVARNRYKIFGKKNQCLLPTGDLRERFLGNSL
jgi:predicted DCC family thiol-disulfide oxidoreductase YuxK